MYEIVESSPKVLAKIENFEDKIGVDENAPATKYPFPKLKIGQSFAVPVSEGNEASLRNGATAHGKASGKKFFVTKHKELACFECARLA